MWVYYLGAWKGIFQSVHWQSNWIKSPSAKMALGENVFKKCKSQFGSRYSVICQIEDTEQKPFQVFAKYKVSFKCFRIICLHNSSQKISQHRNKKYIILYFVPFKNKFLVEKYFCLTAKYLFDMISPLGKSIKLLIRVWS